MAPNGESQLRGSATVGRRQIDYPKRQANIGKVMDVPLIAVRQLDTTIKETTASATVRYHALSQQ